MAKSIGLVKIKKFIEDELKDFPFVELDDLAEKSGISEYRIKKMIGKLDEYYTLHQIDPPKGPYIILPNERIGERELINFLMDIAENYTIKRETVEYSFDTTTTIHLDFPFTDNPFHITVIIKTSEAPPEMSINMTMYDNVDTQAGIITRHSFSGWSDTKWYAIAKKHIEDAYKEWQESEEKKRIKSEDNKDEEDK